MKTELVFTAGTFQMHEQFFLYKTAIGLLVGASTVKELVV
jgi:hypothetical protein